MAQEINHCAQDTNKVIFLHFMLDYGTVLIFFPLLFFSNVRYIKTKMSVEIKKRGLVPEGSI
jgi:hypothetical protein